MKLNHAIQNLLVLQQILAALMGVLLYENGTTTEFGIIELIDGTIGTLLGGEPHRAISLGATLNVLRNLDELHKPNLLEVVL